MINLFPRTSEPLRPDGTRSEYRLVADAHRENSVEIHSIRNLRAATPQGTRRVPAYYGHSHTGEGLYWHARRVQGLNPARPGSDLLPPHSAASRVAAPRPGRAPVFAGSRG